MNAYTRTISLFAIVGALILVGCSSIVPKVKKPCETAMECAEIRTLIDVSCKTAFPNTSEDSYWLANNHQSRRIFVTYEETVRHINSPQSDSKGTKMLSVPPGQMLILGCWRTKGLLDNTFDQYSYTKVTACFSDQCPAPSPKKPTNTRDPSVKCSDLCKQGDPSCLVADLGGSIPNLGSSLSKMNHELLTNKLPTQVNLSPLANLVNVANGNTDCKRTDMEIITPVSGPFQFRNTGSTCQLTAGITTAVYDQFRIEFPGEWNGTFQRSTTEFTLAATSLLNSPTLWVHTSSSDAWEADEIIASQGLNPQGSSNSWVFTGNKYYCVEVTGIGGW